MACLQNMAACWLALAIGAAMLALARPKPEKALARLGAANLFILALWLITPWTTPGEAVLSWRGFAITRQGLDLCLALTLKANAIVAVFLALVAPLSLSGLAAGLKALRCPQKLVWLILLMERNVFILKNEWRWMLEAAKLRGFAPRTSRHTYRTLAAMLALLLARAHDRGQKLHEAMLLAGFDGSVPFRPLPGPGSRDFTFLILMLACSAAMIAFNYA